jgi:hypothetical protein
VVVEVVAVEETHDFPQVQEVREEHLVQDLVVVVLMVLVVLVDLVIMAAAVAAVVGIMEVTMEELLVVVAEEDLTTLEVYHQQHHIQFQFQVLYLELSLEEFKLK